MGGMGQPKSHGSIQECQAQGFPVGGVNVCYSRNVWKGQETVADLGLQTL